MKIGSTFRGKDIFSLEQFDKTSLHLLFKRTDLIIQNLKNAKYSNILKRSVIALLFFEPSTRTYNSFSSAVLRLGGGVIGTQDFTVTSMAKGESFEDTIKMYSGYADAIVIRHPAAGSAIKAAEIADIPVINAGDGINEHPTQGLLDIYTIQKKCKKLNNLTGVIAGDLLNGRTVHSLLACLTIYKNNTVYLLSPHQLKLKKEQVSNFKKKGLKLFEISSEKYIPQNADFWYWTRIQKERFITPKDYKKLKNNFTITERLLAEKGNKNMIIMHPLPRVGEIANEVDMDPRAYYFRQAKNGLYVRMALLSLVLAKS